MIQESVDSCGTFLIRDSYSVQFPILPEFDIQIEAQQKKRIAINLIACYH